MEESLGPEHLWRLPQQVVVGLNLNGGCHHGCLAWQFRRPIDDQKEEMFFNMFMFILCIEYQQVNRRPAVWFDGGADRAEGDCSTILQERDSSAC